MHALGSFAAMIGLYLPAAQAIQPLDDGDTRSGEYRPASQGVQLIASIISLLNVPAGQTT